ncbi:methyl-accepting chemotaxis protein [Carboxylicivirga marina]|uniref:MCP four helix bundle domain-containing protein n=1 Tax=Carboxylicivirga marina TaxID=2800988 RepID=A0ABS1HPG4_9BACT|nr:methyl-accepting chemotaxis protein [Carboxylicivirga marina]MBK3519576.1 MCP four helix bundle domain-containing protein [Carboxylicivirga marina]
MFNKLKVGTTLAVGFAIVIVTFLIVSIFAINRMDVLSDLTSKLYKHPYAVSNAVLSIERDIVKMHRSMKDVALAHDESGIRKASRLVDDFEQDVYKRFDIIEERFLGKDEMWMNAKDMFRDWKPIRNEVIELMREGQRLEAAEITKGKGARHVEALNASIKELANFAANKAIEFDSNATDVRAFSFRLIYSLIALAIIFGIILAIMITRTITGQLGCEPAEAVEVARSLTEGDLTYEFPHNSNNGLYGYLRKMFERQKEVVTAIIVSSQNVSSASSQLNGGAQEISNGVNTQAASSEEVSTSMEEMVANIQQNTENALKTKDISVASSQAIESVTQASQNSMDAVKDINAKINIVVEIAEKTDLLAINAAVEAARAGDEGRGFAVVAAEVRKLAERSQMAANEIVTLAERGLQTTVESNDKLTAIVPNITETTRLVEEIATASKEQEIGANQVNNAVQQLSNVTQQNASSAEEMASSAEELDLQAGELENITRQFKLEHNLSNSRFVSGNKKGPISQKQELSYN